VAKEYDAHENYETYRWYLNDPADIKPPVVLEIGCEFGDDHLVTLQVW
jgi:hypothetical protein